MLWLGLQKLNVFDGSFDAMFVLTVTVDPVPTRGGEVTVYALVPFDAGPFGVEFRGILSGRGHPSPSPIPVHPHLFEGVLGGQASVVLLTVS